MSEWVVRVSDDIAELSLTEPERNNNGYCFFSNMSNKGWSLSAIAGALGNIRYESSINPGACEIGRGEPRSGSLYYAGGLGLIQWTDYPPYTGQYVNPLLWYANSVSANWWSGNLQCDLIDLADDPTVTDCGVGQGARWGWQYNTHAYLSYDDYKIFSGTPEEAAEIWMYSMERPGSSASLAQREFYASYWYDWLGGQTPDVPTDPNNPDYEEETYYSDFWVLLGRKRRKL